MGTWYETDFLSHLHIEEGENAVMILLKQRNQYCHESHACSNVYDKYDVFGLPIHGKYNGIGGLTDIKDKKHIVEFLNAKKLVYQIDKSSSFPIYLKETEDNFKDFFSHLVHEEIYTSRKELITRILINEELYDLLINDYKARIDKYNMDGYTYEQIFDVRCNNFLESIPEKIKKAKIYDDQKTQEECYFEGYSIPCFDDDLKDFHSICVSSSIQKDDVISYLLERAYKEKESKDIYLRYIKEIVFFYYVIDSMRSGYLCVSGIGSEMREMYLQKLLAEYILKRCNEYVAEYRKENTESVTDKDILYDEVSEIMWLRI